MTVFLDICAAVFVIIGLFFFALGALGIIRMPDTYHRLHAASKSSTLGLLGLLIGVTFHLDTADVVAKASAVVVFAFVATPIGSHILAKAALRARNPQWEQTLSDEHAEDGLS